MTSQSAAPYALKPHRFPFRDLARQVGHGALGGEREAALACLMAARLAAGVLPPLQLPAPMRVARGAAVRSWMATLALPAALRIPLARVVDASAGEDALRLAQNVRGLAVTAAEWLDPLARAELERLALVLGEDAPARPRPG